MNNLKYIIYLRKSSESEDRQVASIDDQKREIAQIVKHEQLKVVAIYQESKSARKVGREQFNLMVKDFEKGKADALLVWHINRIARNPQDGSKIIDFLDRGILHEIKSTTGIFRNYSSDKMMLQIELAISKKYSDDLSDVVKRGIRNKFIERKEWIALAKQGYINVRNTRTGKVSIEVDPVRFSLLQKAGQLIISGKYTANEVWSKLNYEWGYKTVERRVVGGKPIAKCSFYRFLSDPYYYGLMVACIDGKKVEIQGNHIPMFSKNEWDKIQIRLGRGIRRNNSKHDFAFKGIMKCGECGSSITVQEKWQIICSKCKYKFHVSEKRTQCPNCQTYIADMKDHKVLHYIYYGCTKKIRRPDGFRCTQKHIQLKDIEAQVDAYLGKITIAEEFKDWAIQYINEYHDQESLSQHDIVKNLNKQLESCKERLSNLLKLKISPNNVNGSLLSDDEYEKQRAELVTERDRYVAQIEASNSNQDEYLELTKQTFDFACYARYWFNHGDTAKKTQILNSLGYNLKLLDKKILIEQHKPFFLIEKFNNEVKEIIQKIEPEKKIGNDNNLLSLEPVRILWSGRGESNSRHTVPNRVSYH